MTDIEFYKWLWGNKWYLNSKEIYNWNMMNKIIIGDLS